MREIAVAYSSSTVLMRAVAVPADSSLVDRLIDCSKLPVSDTGLSCTTPKLSVRLRGWLTFRRAVLLSSPRIFQDTGPLTSTCVVVGGAGIGGGVEITW